MRPNRLVVHQQLTVTMVFIAIQIALLLSFHIEAICCTTNTRHSSTTYHRYDVGNGQSSPHHYQQHRLSIINERKGIPKEEQEKEQREVRLNCCNYIFVHTKSSPLTLYLFYFIGGKLPSLSRRAASTGGRAASPAGRAASFFREYC